jgi:hypothetical protein
MIWRISLIIFESKRIKGIKSYLILKTNRAITIYLYLVFGANGPLPSRLSRLRIALRKASEPYRL